MADSEVTPPIGHIWPPAPLYGDPAPASFRTESIELTQSGGRLVAVNHFMRRMFALQMCILALSCLSPFYSYWTSPFHHATWRAMLPAVFVTYKQTFWIELLLLFVAALFCWVLIVCGNLSGIILNQQDGTTKAGGRTRPLSEIGSVEVIERQPDILGRRYTVQLHWNDERVLLWWQRALFSMEPKTSFVGVFRQEANADRVATAIAEFANMPVQHRTR